MREVVEGEAGGAGESAGGRSVGVGRLGWLEPSSQCGTEETEEERRVEGPVAAEEGGAGDEAVEGGASGGGAGEVGRGCDPEEDLLQEVVGEGGCLRRRRHFLRGSSSHPANNGEGRGSRFEKAWAVWAIVGFGGPN